MLFYKRILLLTLLFGFFLSGCQTPSVFYQSEGNIADAAQSANAAERKSDMSGKRVSPLVVNTGSYIDKRPIDLACYPSWLRNRVIIHGDQLPFSYFTGTIADGAKKNVMTQYQFGLDANTKISMNYSGDVKGALDLLAAKTGYVYTIHRNHIYWQAFVTKSFDIAFMPGGADYEMGKAQGSTGSNTAGSGSNTQVTGIIDDNAQQQYSSLKGTLSLWDDLKSTLQQLASADGKVMVSQATTTVIVRDRPANIDLISQYIANLNRTLTKQVLVKVQMLEINLSSDFNYGINWNIIQRAMGGSNWVLNASYGTPLTLSPFTIAPATYGLQFNPTSLANGGTGYEALINALKQQGKVSIVSEPRVICLNNQVSAIRLVTQAGYLASIQNTTVAGAAGTGAAGTITSQITPGTLVTGLTLYVLPKIMGNKVSLQINADLSNNLGFRSISSAPAGSTSGSVIEAPNVTQKSFNQRSVIGSGETLILAGFRQIQNTTGALQLFDSQALGGRAALQSNNETIILITPIILHGTA